VSDLNSKNSGKKVRTFKEKKNQKLKARQEEKR